MQQHPLVTAAKLGLMALILLLLVLDFTAHNDTQEKVIESARMVDELRDGVANLRRDVGDESTKRSRAVAEIQTAVADIQRRLDAGIALVGEGGSRAPPKADRGPEPEAVAGFESILSPEPDRPRPEDRIDWDAEFRTATLSEPKGLNLLTSDRDRTVNDLLAQYVYMPLAERHDAQKDRFKPGLAEWVGQSEDRCTFLIRIRKGVFWHRPALDLTNPTYAWMKGEHEVTAHDLKFSMDMILNERADTAILRSSFVHVKSYEVVDRYTFKIVWDEPDYYARGLILEDLRPMPAWIFTREEDGSPIEEAAQGQAFANHWFSKSMCGYGPYRFKEYKKEDYILLERDEDYWGQRPGFKTIYYKLTLVKDEPRYNLFMRFDEEGERQQDGYAMSSTRLKRDLLDNDGSSELYKQLKAERIFLYGPIRWMYAYTGWQCKSKFFNDKRVRLAMTLAANRDAWNREIFHDEAIFGTGIAPIESPEYDQTVKSHPYDLERAAKLLGEAGWVDTDGNGVREKMIDGEKVEFRFKLLESANSQVEIDATRQDWQQSLRKIGVIMEPDTADWSLFIKKVRDREFDACSLAWFLGNDFMPYTLLHSRLIDEPGSYNYVQWSNARADEIMDALRVEFEPEKRYQLAHELHRIFHEEQPYTLLWTWRNSVAWDSRLGGYEKPRPFAPRISWLMIYKVKDPPAPYDDDRYTRFLRPEDGGPPR